MSHAGLAYSCEFKKGNFAIHYLPETAQRWLQVNLKIIVMSQSVFRRWIHFLFTSWGDVSLSIPLLLKEILKDNTRVSGDIRLHFEQLLQVTENLQKSFIQWCFQAPSITVRICPGQVEYKWVWGGTLELNSYHLLYSMKLLWEATFLLII